MLNQASTSCSQKASQAEEQGGEIIPLSLACIARRLQAPTTFCKTEGDRESRKLYKRNTSESRVSLCRTIQAKATSTSETAIGLWAVYVGTD